MWKLKVSQGGSERNDSRLKSTNNHMGRQFWEFDPDLGIPEERDEVENIRKQFTKNKDRVKHSSDLLMRLQFEKERGSMKMSGKVEVKSEEDISVEAVEVTLKRALRMYSTLQTDDGFWPADYGGPLFLLPGLVIGLYVTGSLNAILPVEHRREMCRYLYNHQNKDGGWGLHIEGSSTMFCTALSYVTLRLLGQKMDGGDGAMSRARNWIHLHKGVTYIPSWGKLWLSVKNLNHYLKIP